MKRILGRLLAAITVVGGACAFQPGCVHNDSSLYIHSILAPPKRNGEAGCTYTNDAQAAQIFSGVLDVAFGGTYEAMILLGNQQVVRASADNGRVETSRIMLQGATVRVTDSAGNEVSSFTRLGSGVIEPGRSTTPGYGLFNTVLIDPKSSEFAKQGLDGGRVRRLVAFFKIFGQTLGGRAVESAEYQFPVDVCFRCLIKFGGDTEDKAKKAETGRSNCDAPLAAGVERPCIYGQDQAFACTLCSSNPVCKPDFAGSVTNPESATTTTSAAVDLGGGG